MAVPLSQLKNVIKLAALAVTNATEELFQQGLYIQSIDQGIQFSVDVYDDTREMAEMEVNEENAPEVVTKQSSEEMPATTQQSQSYGRSSTATTEYKG